MNGESFDAGREVGGALSTAVSSYGMRVLDNPRTLGNMMTDLLPNLPLERSLLATAATAGVGADLAQRVGQQQLTVETAINLVAQSLTQNRGLDPAASRWVTTEYARALGYSVPEGFSVPPEAAPFPTDGPSLPPGGGIGNEDGYKPTEEARPWTPGPGPGPWGPGPGQGQGPGQGPWGGGGTGAGNRGSRSRLPFLVGGGVAAVIVLYLIIAAVAQAFPFSKSHSNAGPQPGPVTQSASATPTPSGQTSSGPTATASGVTSSGPTPSSSFISDTPSAPSTTPSLSLASGVKPLTALLPNDIHDVTTECSNDPTSEIPWQTAGLVKAFYCTAPDFSGGSIYGYQSDNYHDYDTTWVNFNKWAGFSATGSLSCPPTGNNSFGGPNTWSNAAYPKVLGQVVECYTAKAGEVVYVWTYPTEDAFIWALAPKSWTMTELNTWWSHT